MLLLRVRFLLKIQTPVPAPAPGKIVDSGGSLHFRLEQEPVSSEISDLLLFFSYFASKNREIKSGYKFFDVCCVN